MSIHEIYFGSLMARINTLGAELQHLSFTKDKSNVFWSAQEPWQRSSPWLFPVIGRLQKDQFAWRGKEYLMSQHGFLRDVEFNVQKKSETELRLHFSYKQLDKKNQNSFPFEFSVEIHFYFARNKFNIDVSIKNESSNEILPFSFGWHPAFNVLAKNDGCSFELKSTQSCTNLVLIHKLNEQGYIDFKLKNETKTNEFQINELQSIERAEILSGHEFQAYSVSKLRVSLNPACDQLAIWSRDKTKFLCVEPWWGGGYYNINENHDPFAIKLNPQDSKKFHFDLYLNES